MPDFDNCTKCGACQAQCLLCSTFPDMRAIMKHALVLLTAILLPMLTFAECRAQGEVSAPSQRPLIIFYSLSGTTRTLAEETARLLGCEMLELKSTRSRTGFWKVNCVFDQLFDRDDELEPVTISLEPYNPIILAAPVWIHRYASPMRTFLKQPHLNGKNVYGIAAHRGNYREQDGQAIMRQLGLQARCLKGFTAICTKEKTPQQLRDQIQRELKSTSLLSEGAAR